MHRYSSNGCMLMKPEVFSPLAHSSRPVVGPPSFTSHWVHRKGHDKMRQASLWWLIVLGLLWSSTAQQKVAIIGSGMAGASAAYFMHKQDSKLQIDVFEADQEGGRAKNMLYKGQRLELGASIIWEFNNYLAAAAKDLHLRIRWLSPPTHPDNITAAAGVAGDGQLKDARSDEVFSIWDGNKFVMTNDESWWNKVRLVWRYGLTPLLYGKRAEEAGEHFKSIYSLQDRGEWFRTPEELLIKAGLYNYTQQRCREYMQAHLKQWWLWGREAFIEELAGAINRCNYNQQSSNMNAMAGLVSYLPATGGGVWQVAEGNSQLAAGMLSRAASVVSLGTRISHISKHPDGSFNLTSSPASGQAEDEAEEHGPYAAVIIASPLELSGIQLVGPEGRQHRATAGGEADGSVLKAGRAAAGDAQAGTCAVGEYWGGAQAGGECRGLPPRQFQKTVTTYVDGKLQPSAFGVNTLPAHTIFVTEHAGTDFSSISRTSYEGGSLMTVYKVFSSEPLADSRIQQLFGADAKVVQVKEWMAYPKFAPPEQFAPFELVPGVCATSSLENSASAMEVAAVAGRNCALMTLAHLKSGRQASAAA